MSLSDPLGDMLTRIRNALWPQEVERLDAGFAPARPASSTC